jgi:sensor histidine kinase regulating citrate/malate metabolism
MKNSLRTSDSNTLPLTVSNTGFLLDRLGQDCHPLQFLRELTQNAIEAIHRTSEEVGEIIWDVDWTSYELEQSGVFKLSVTDTGDGMTGEEMVKYINQLSSSLQQQSLSGNYGVGAKIAAATRNHAGLIYLSWKAEQGAMIHLWRDPDTGQYGLRQITRPDGTFRALWSA